MQSPQGQKTFVVPKDELLKILKANRNKHAEEFVIANTEFRKEAIGEMNANLIKAKEGGIIVRHLGCERPQSHTEEYDNVIGMLELTLDTKIDITFGDYKQYVKDEWSWSKQWEIANSKYLGVKL